jgi:hypothetical protein
MIDFTLLACPQQVLFGLTLALSAAGSTMSYMGAMNRAKEQEAYQDHLADIQKRSSQRRITSVQIKAAQEKEAMARKMYEVSQQSAKLAAQSRLSAAEGGVTGTSINLLLQSYEAQEGAFIAALESEQRMREAQDIRTIGDISIGAEQQLAATQSPVNYPSALAEGLNWAAGASKLAYQHYSSDPANKKSTDMSVTSPLSPLGLSSVRPYDQ